MIISFDRNEVIDAERLLSTWALCQLEAVAMIEKETPWEIIGRSRMCKRSNCVGTLLLGDSSENSTTAIPKFSVANGEFVVCYWELCRILISYSDPVHCTRAMLGDGNQFDFVAAFIAVRG